MEPAPDFNRAVREFLEWETAKGASRLTLRAYALDLRRVLSYLATVRISSLPELTRQVMLGYRMTLTHLAPRTVRRRMAMVGAFSRFLVDMGYIQANPVARIPLPKVPQEQRRVLSEREFQSLLDLRLPIRERAMLLLLMYTGMRRAEVAAVQVQDLRWDDPPTLVVRGKGMKQRILPLHPVAAEAVQMLLSVRDTTEAALFLTMRGRPCGPQAVDALLHMLQRLPMMADVTAHTFRRTFATMVHRQGAGLRTIQVLLGHASIVTTQVYIQPDADAQREAVSRLPS